MNTDIITQGRYDDLSDRCCKIIAEKIFLAPELEQSNNNRSCCKTTERTSGSQRKDQRVPFPATRRNCVLSVKRERERKKRESERKRERERVACHGNPSSSSRDLVNEFAAEEDRTFVPFLKRRERLHGGFAVFCNFYNLRWTDETGSGTSCSGAEGCPGGPWTRRRGTRGLALLTLAIANAGAQL